jgi:ABC-type dipeptide/oligopeptide/nickel transport system permease component
VIRVIINKVTSSIATVFGASVVAFVLLRVLPGDPARLIAGSLASDEAIAGVRHQLGLDQPLHVQYIRYISDFFTGDWGFSFSAGVPVREILGDRFPATAELALYAFVFAFLSALVLALLATYREWPVVDGVVRALSSFGLGTPPFWFAILALIVFFEQFKLLPGPSGRLGSATIPPPQFTGFYTIDALVAGQFDVLGEAIKHLILPVVSLGLVPFAFLVRLLRANLLETSSEPFIVVVRSKGIGRWLTHVRHVLPNAFLPTLTASGLMLAELLTGSVLVETIFNWPGVGALVVDSIKRQDFAVVQTFILLSASLYLLVNLVVDILYGIIDPRTRIPTTEAR